MMPHPERASDIELNNTDGKILFESILKPVLTQLLKTINKNRDRYF